MKYIGETSQSLRNRINSHKNGIRRDKDILLYRHSRCDDRHRNRCIEDLIEVQIVERIVDLDVEMQLDRKLTERSLLQEYFWMITLFTVDPYGLNDKVKSFGSVYSNTEVCQKFNHHHLAFKNIHIFVGRKRKRKRIGQDPEICVK
jgi:hypothetical protein